MSVTLCKTHYLEQKLLSAIFNNTSYVVTNTYLGLFTVAPDKTGGGTEVSTSGTAYARQLLAPILSTGVLVYSPLDGTGSTIKFATVNFPAATGGGFGAVLAVGVFDASSGGNLLYYQTVTSITISAGIVATFANGNLSVLEA